MKYLFTALTALFILSSCEMTNVLDVSPPNDLTSGNVISDVQSAEELLNGAYSILNNRYYYIYTESAPGLLSGSMLKSGFLADEEFAQNNITVDNGTAESLWQVFYKMTDAANVVIELVGEMPASEFADGKKEEILAEAHFLRALCHFNLLRYFGQFYDPDSPLGIIIRTEPANFVTRNKARSPVQKVYDQIIKDLDVAIKNGPDFTVPYYASKISAKALKAKVLLYLGRSANAAALADEVINNNGIRSLAPTYADVFAAGLKSEEMIFMRYTDEITFTASRKKFRYGSYVIASDWLKNLMNTDPRAPLTYDSASSEILKVNDVDNFSPTYFMRLAQVYLIKAEALARSTNSTLADAKAPLEMVRSRALGVPYTSPATTKAELLDEIFDEIVSELAFENGSEWFAAIRFGKIMDLKPQITSENQFILPIPQGELEANTKFGSQNPGYSQ